MLGDRQLQGSFTLFHVCRAQDAELRPLFGSRKRPSAARSVFHRTLNEAEIAANFGLRSARVLVSLLVFQSFCAQKLLTIQYWNNRERRPVGLFLKGGKTAQLRSKTASSSTTLKVEVFQKVEKRLNFAPKQPLFLWSLRGHYGHYAVTTRSLRSLRGHYGHYAVTTQSLRSLRSLRGHYGHYAVRKSTRSRLRKLLTSLQNGLFDQDVVAVGL